MIGRGIDTERRKGFDKPRSALRAKPNLKKELQFRQFPVHRYLHCYNVAIAPFIAERREQASGSFLLLLLSTLFV